MRTLVATLLDYLIHSVTEDFNWGSPTESESRKWSDRSLRTTRLQISVSDYSALCVNENIFPIKGGGIQGMKMERYVWRKEN